MEPTTKRRNTALFYALMAQLPGYDRRYADVIKESIVEEYLERKHGPRHGREPRLSALNDDEFRELTAGLRADVRRSKSAADLQQEAVRKVLVHQILMTLSRIGATVTDGDYARVNYHIQRLPISKGRIIPQFSTDELPRLLGAVRAYAGNIRKRQLVEQALAERN